MNSYIWHSGCPNYQFTAFVFFIFWLVEEGEVWFEGDSTWLINYKKRIRYCQFFPQAQLSIIFTTIKLIYTLVYQSLNSIFSLCFLLNESFSKCQQSYNRNIPVGYFEGIYTCENLTFHLQTEKDVKFVSEMHKFLENSHYYL